MKQFVATLFLCISCTSPCFAGDGIYFPELAAKAKRHDLRTLKLILSKSENTPPGEQLEELAQLASSYVRSAPSTFLNAQKQYQDCFGVDFLGEQFVDRPKARLREISARRIALMSVTNSDLISVRKRCLTELSGS